MHSSARALSLFTISVQCAACAFAAVDPTHDAAATVTVARTDESAAVIRVVVRAVPARPRARIDATLTLRSDGVRALLVGGRYADDRQLATDVWWLDATSAVWRRAPVRLARERHATVAAGSGWLVVGGDDGNGRAGTPVWIDAGVLNAVSVAGDHAPSARYGLAGARNGSNAIVFGGRTPDDTVVDDTLQFDAATHRWSPFAGGGVLAARSDAAVVVMDGGLFVVGGVRDDAMPDGVPPMRLDLRGNDWRVLSRDDAPAPIAGAYAVPTSAGVAVLTPDALEHYDLARDRWRTLVSMRTRGAQTGRLRDRVVVFGGVRDDARSPMLLVDPDSGRVAVLAAVELSLAREGALVASDGTRVVAWGGRVAGRWRDDGVVVTWRVAP